MQTPLRILVQHIWPDPAEDRLIGEGMRVALAKPQTFMNLAGRSVQTLLHFYKVEPVDLLVIYDDLDLALGVLRLRAAGGSGEPPAAAERSEIRAWWRRAADRSPARGWLRAQSPEPGWQRAPHRRERRCD